LRNHEKFLSPFIKIFKSIDLDSDGIINEVKIFSQFCIFFKLFFEFKNDFKKLLNKINLAKESGDIAKYLDKIDPNSHDNITFSQCIALFSMVFLFFKC